MGFIKYSIIYLDEMRKTMKRDMNFLRVYYTRTFCQADDRMLQVTKNIMKRWQDSYGRKLWRPIRRESRVIYETCGIALTSPVAIPCIVACIQQVTDTAANPCTAHVPCEQWDDFDP
jgi:hypothetical protein